MPRKALSKLDRLYANLVPGVGDGFLLGAVGAVATPGIGNSTPGKGGEIRRRSEAPVGIVSYQICPALTHALPPSAVATRKKAWFGMPELVCTPPLSCAVWT